MSISLHDELKHLNACFDTASQIKRLKNPQVKLANVFTDNSNLSLVQSVIPMFQ